MKLKLNLLLAGFLIIITSCQKSNSNLSSEKQAQTAFEPIKISYEDTTSIYKIFKLSQENKGLSTTSIIPHAVPIALPILELTYRGNGNYAVYVWNNQNNNNIDCTYTLYKNGVQIPVPEYNKLSVDSPNPALVFSWTPDAGNYKYMIYYHNGGPNAGRNAELPITIYNQPTAPSGKLALYRYYNPRTGRRVYTTNWQELASSSHFYIFEKVQGYILPNAGPNTKLIYRYYNRASDDHWLTTSTDGANGYVLEGGVGYISTATTSEMTTPLIEYFSTTLGHSYKSPAEPITPPDFVNGTLGYVMPTQ